MSSTRASIASCTSLPPTHVFTTIGIYKGERVAIKKIAKKKVCSAEKTARTTTNWMESMQTGRSALNKLNVLSYFSSSSLYPFDLCKYFRWILHQRCCGKSSRHVMFVTRTPYALWVRVSTCLDLPYSFWQNIVQKVMRIVFLVSTSKSQWMKIVLCSIRTLITFLLHYSDGSRQSQRRPWEWSDSTWLEFSHVFDPRYREGEGISNSPGRIISVVSPKFDT